MHPVSASSNSHINSVVDDHGDATWAAQLQEQQQQE
jgi:hypothetical protein